MVNNQQHYEPISTETQVQQGPDNSREKPTVFVYYLVFCVCIGGFLFGYDTGGNF